MPTYTHDATGMEVTSDTPLTPAQLQEAFAPTPQNLQGFAVAEAKRQGIEDQAPVILSMLKAESSADANTPDSPKGAMGPMQLMPGTAKELGVNPRDPWDNIRGGVRYYKQQLDRFGDPQLAAAAYNAGPGNVQKYGGVPPFAETLGYVQKTTPTPTPMVQRASSKAVDIPDVETLVRNASTELRRQDLSQQLSDPYRSVIPGGLPEPVDPLSQWPLLLPPGTSAVSSGLIGGGAQMVHAAQQMVSQRMEASQKQGTTAKLLDAISQTQPGDLVTLGEHFVLGAAVSAGTYGIARLLTGPMRGIEPSRVSEMPPPSPLKSETVNPTVPTADQVAAVTAREAQTADKLAAQSIVGKASGIEAPIYPSPMQDATIKALRQRIPQPSKEATDRAYTTLREVYDKRTGGAPVDVTDIVDALAGMRASINARSGTVPAAIDPTDLMVIPHDPTPPEMIGSGARMARRWMAPLGAVQRKMSAINQLKNNAMERAAGGVDAADLKYLSRKVYEGLAGQLEGAEPYLLGVATDTARSQAQLQELQVLIDKVSNANGVPVGVEGARTLLKDPKGWQQALGEFYDPALTWFRQVAKLQEKEVGAKAVEAIAKATQADAMAMAQAHQSNLDTLLGDAQARASTAAGNTAAAISQAARPPAMGAHPAVRATIETAAGAGLGAGIAGLLGQSATTGALIGSLGGGLASKLSDPVFRRAFDAMARHPVGTQLFFREAGRLGLLLVPPPAPQPMPSHPIDQLLAGAP